MKLNWIESTDIFHDAPVYSLVDENDFELIWFYCEENIKKWVVTLNVPKKETVYYNIENAKDIKEITNVSYPKLLEEIYNNEISKTVWTKENMEQNLIKMIGEIDESC